MPALEDPCGMTTDGGMPTSGGEADKAMDAPPEGAGASSVTEQAKLAGGVNCVDGQVKASKAGNSMATIPLAADVLSESPDASDAVVAESCKEAEESGALFDSVMVILATAPFAIKAFCPQATQVVVPAVPLHDRLLPAEVAAEPAVIVAAEKSAAG